jgi:5-methylcytosine-specific restriction endonuclease McrA
MGHIVTEETKVKIIEKQKGRPKPPRDHKYKWNEASKRKWSETQKGKKGKKHTLASRQLMSKIAKIKHPIVKTDESKLARKRFEYKVWRQEVYIRDNYTCLKCGSHGGRLQPHHIANFSENPDIRYDVANGGTLCVSCHRVFHKKYGKKRNNGTQFAKFILQK